MGAERFGMSEQDMVTTPAMNTQAVAVDYRQQT
jgi:hypothetical protein